MLLAVSEERRPTRDVDLLGMAIANDAESVAALVTEITAIDVGDGVVFRPGQLTTQTIREQDVYVAVRVTMPATVATAEVALKVDINVGDPVTPAPVEVTYPALLGEPFTMIGQVQDPALATTKLLPRFRGHSELWAKGPGEGVPVARPSKYPREFREAAVETVRETGEPIAHVARELGMNEGTLGNWVAADRRRRGEQPDDQVSETERAELVRPRREKRAAAHGEGDPGDAAAFFVTESTK